MNDDAVDLPEQGGDGLPASGRLKEEAEVSDVPLSAVPAVVEHSKQKTQKEDDDKQTRQGATTQR